MIGGKSLQFGDRIWFFLGGYHRADSPIAGRVGKKHFSCPSLWGFHPHAPGYFLLVQKVTKNTRGGEGFRFPSPPRTPSHYSPQEPRFTRGIAAATYAKNMPQAYFLNAAALAREATPPSRLEGLAAPQPHGTAPPRRGGSWGLPPPIPPEITRVSVKQF